MTNNVPKFSPTALRPILIGAAVFCVALTAFAVRALFIDTVAANLDMSQPGADVILDWLTSSSAAGSNAHLKAAVYYERTFDAGNLDRAMQEYHRAAELSPNDYVVWMNLALALSRSGDADSAESAFKRARELAPSYSEVDWAYGNFLVRQGRETEGFPLIARAATVDPKIAGPAVTITLQASNGDINRVRSLLGGDPQIELALATTTAALKRYDDSRDAWQRIPLELRRGMYRADGEKLINLFVGAGYFRSAAAVAADLSDTDQNKPAVGQITNGGFEGGVKVRMAGPFEWQIAEGAEPQIGLSETQVHGGRYSLSMAFNTFRPEGFRDVYQIVPVEPGRSYRLQLWYKSTLKSTAKFKWLVSDPMKGSVIVLAPELAPAADWTMLGASFVVPQDADGIKLQFIREGCGSVACPASGNIIFDDIALIPE